MKVFYIYMYITFTLIYNATIFGTVFSYSFYMMLIEKTTEVRENTKTDTHKEEGREGWAKKREERGKIGERREVGREYRLENRLKSESTDLASAQYRGYKPKEKSNYLS